MPYRYRPEVLEQLGLPHEERRRTIERFREHDEALLRATFELHHDEQKLAELDLPSIVFRSGDLDLNHPRETSERVAAGLPGARLVEPPWGEREWHDRQDARNRGEGSLFDRWHLLVPQLLEWADEVVPR